MLDHDLESFVFGHVVLDTWEARLLPIQRHLPPRVPVENHAVGRREERLSDRPLLLGHPAHSDEGDRPTQLLVGRMGPQCLGGALYGATAVGVPLSTINGHGSPPRGYRSGGPPGRPTHAGDERSRWRDWRYDGHPRT